MSRMKFIITIERNFGADYPPGAQMRQDWIYKWIAWFIKKCPYSCRVKELEGLEDT